MKYLKYPLTYTGHYDIEHMEAITIITNNYEVMKTAIEKLDNNLSASVGIRKKYSICQQ